MEAALWTLALATAVRALVGIVDMLMDVSERAETREAKLAMARLAESQEEANRLAVEQNAEQQHAYRHFVENVTGKPIKDLSDAEIVQLVREQKETT